jgi:hypothetical protein
LCPREWLAHESHDFGGWVCVTWIPCAILDEG